MKNKTLEECYLGVFEFLNEKWITQGLETELQVETIDEEQTSDKKENVIIEGNEGNLVGGNDKIEDPTLAWANTEKYYNFVEGNAAVMARWFPLDTITITDAYKPSVNGGFVKSWIVPESLITQNFDSINILPIRGFLKGEYEIEFKLLAQANSFQQCLIMLSLAPFSYGIVPDYNSISGLRMSELTSSSPLRPWVAFTEKKLSYNDFQCAIQRPNVILDVSSGGEVTLKMAQKYHKTLIRNFDFATYSGVNSGIRGSNMGSISLHVLSTLKYGTGTNNFNVRLFYRFVKANLTAMVPVVNIQKGKLHERKTKISIEQLPEAFKAIKLIQETNDHQKAEADLLVFKSKYSVQGPMMSILSGVKTVTDTTSDIIGFVERAGSSRRKGINIRNRDKPVDVISQIRNVPRPRTNFSSGTGIDDSIVMGISWDEITEFFQTFTDEPKNFKDYTSIAGYLDSFIWYTNAPSGASLFEWKIHPTLMPHSIREPNLAANIIRNPLMIASSSFTNYWGTIELMFQFVKTNSHRGAVEVSIYFGGATDGSGLKSTYVKVMNVQENPVFKVTIPYIYDTTVRTSSGTATPLYVPNLSQTTEYMFYHTATLKVRVLNELSAVSVVSQSVDCIIWIKGGMDFGLNFPHAINTCAVPLNFRQDIVLNPTNPQLTYKSSEKMTGYYWDAWKGQISQATQGKYYYVTQGLDGEDFRQGNFVNNRITNTDHMDFKTLLKMPVKILSEFNYTPTTTFDFTDIRNNKLGTFTQKNYFSIPVCPLNISLVNFLNSQYFNGRAQGSFKNNSIVGNFESWKSIQGQIMSMFMLFRGTITYTIIITETTKPVYYTYIPHDYNLKPLLGPITKGNMLAYTPGGDGANMGYMGSGILGMVDDKDVDLAFGGLINGFIIPSINPTERISIPMSTQNNYLLLNRQQAAQTSAQNSDHSLKTMRENSEWFNGTLSLWSSDKFSVDLYLNCGDDMELGGFMGHPGINNVYSQFAMPDHWRVQGLDLDFHIKEITQYGWSSLKKASIGFGVGLLTACMTRMVTPEVASITGAIAVYSTIGGIKQLRELCCDLPKMVTDNTTGVVDELTTIGTENLIAIIQEYFPFLKSSVNYMGNTIWAVSQQMIHAVLAKNWKNTAFSLFCILVELHLVKVTDWEKLKEVMENCVSIILPSAFTCQGINISQDSMDNAWMPMMELLVSLIGIRFQMSSIGGLRNYLRDIFKYQNYKNISGINNILAFSRTVFRAVSLIVKTCFQQKDPNIVLLEKIQSKDKLMGEFIVEANKFLSMFSEADFKKKEKRVEFFHTILRAYKLRMLLIKIGNPRLTSQLLSLCEKVIDKANKSRYLLRSDIITREPFIICLEGFSNIGKSFSVYDLVGELLNSTDVKYTNPDLVFTIPAGVDYWNGYLDQPALWYDDWCNISDEQTMRQHISQLYALKTSAPFNVPRAELENKEQIATPQLVVLTTNIPFPVSNVMAYPKAVYRRRDVLVKFSLKEGKTIKDFTQRELEQFQHLDVQFYDRVEDPNSLQNTKMSYMDFIEEMKLRFKKFRMQEAANQKQKYKSLLKAVEKSPIDDLDFENPFISIEKFVYEDAENVTQEILDSNVEELLNLIHEHCQIEKNSPTNSQIFGTQGFLGEIGKIGVSLVDNISDKFSDWYQAVNRKTMKCNNCSCFAPVHGTVFWCNTHSHYICLHCSTRAGLCNLQKEFDRDVLQQFQDGSWQAGCPAGMGEENKCEVIITDVGFFSALFAEIVGKVIETPHQLYSMIRVLVVKSEAPLKVKTLYTLVMMAKIYFFCLSAFVRGRIHSRLANGVSKLQSQGLEIDTIVISKEVRSYIDDYIKREIYLRKVEVTEEDQWVCLDKCNSEECKHRVLLSTVQELIAAGRDEDTIDCSCVYPVVTKCPIHFQTDHLFSEINYQAYVGGELCEKKDYCSIYNSLIEHEPHTTRVPNYICQHSLLYFGFSYSMAKYYLVSQITDGLVLEDKVCDANGRCCLLNKTYIELLRNKFVYDDETIATIVRTLDSELLQYWVPKFLHFHWFKKIQQEKKTLLEILRKDWWEVYVSPVGKWFMDLAKKILPVIIAGGVLWGSWYIAKKAWTFLARLFGLEDVQGLINSGSSPSRKPKSRAKTRNPYHTHALEVDENYENKLGKIAANYATIQAGRSFISVWGIKGSSFFVPKHLAIKIKNEPSFKLRRVFGSQATVEILTSNIVINEIAGCDLAIVVCLRTVPLFKDCSSFLRSIKENSEFIDGIFMACHPITGDLEDVDVKIISRCSNFDAVENSTGTIFSTNEAITYNYQKNGLCGSLVCVHSVHPILAMHIAGSDSLNRGVGVLIYREMLDEMEFKSQGFECARIFDSGEETQFYGDGVEIDYLASVEKEFVPYVPKVTNIIPSLINGEFDSDPKTQPAILSKQDPRYCYEKSPLFNGVIKNGKPTLDFSIKSMASAFSVLKSKLLKGRLIRKPSILTVKEAVTGFPNLVVDDRYSDTDDLYYDSIPTDTSSGFPYSSNYVRKLYSIDSTNKEAWLGVVRDESCRIVDCEIHPYLQINLDEHRNLREKRILTPNIFQDCLKDERRKIDKVYSEGGTRLFSMSNLEGTIALRQYTLDLTSYLRFNRIKNGIAVGINCDSMEWTILANALLSISNNIFTTDFSNFGSGLNIGVASYFADLIKEFYITNSVDLKDSDINVIDTLIMELLNSKHIVGNLIYGTVSGSPSGAAITVEINSFVHLMYIYLTFKIVGECNVARLCGQQSDYSELLEYLNTLDIGFLDFSYEAFLTNVFCCTYGDDGIFSVSEEYKEIFNAVTINLVLKKHRIGVTDASKSERIIKYGPLDKATFLKRSFKKVPEMPSIVYLAAIDWQTVEECVRWIHKKPLTKAVATRENCISSLHLAFGHGGGR